MSEINNYKGYEFKIESIIDTNSPYSDITDLNKFWYKSIIIPPKEKVKRCLNIEYNDIEFTVDYLNDIGLAAYRKVKCDIIVYKDEGYISLEIKDKELRIRDHVLEYASIQLIDHIENLLDSKEDYASSNVSNNNLIERDKIGNLESYETINENLTPRPEPHKLILRHVVNSENSINEIDQIIEMLNNIKSYIV